MSDSEHALRPDAETFDHDGYSVAVIDLPRIRAAAERGRVELLHNAALPRVVREARLSATWTIENGYVFDALLQIGPEREDRTPRITALGSDPLSVFLARRAAAGEPWATRVVDGMGGIAEQISRRFGFGRDATPAPTSADTVTTATRTDARTGLDVTITHRAIASEEDHRSVLLRAEVNADSMAAEHLDAMCQLMVEVVAEFTDEPPIGVLAISAQSSDATEISLDQVGGLDDIVEQLRQIAVSFRHPQAMARWGARRPQGILFYGPAGTGKTMLARALAHEIGARFKEIHTPDILDKWLGASERNIKRIFRDARRYREPTVMLFDEFDSIISYAGEGGDSASQALNSVAGIFKQEMNDLIDNNPQVLVVATTNFADRIDPSLVRSGRFDIKLMVPRPDESARADILSKMIRWRIAEHEVPGFRMFADDLDLAALAVASPGMTGADLGEVLRRAQLVKAMHEARTGAPATPISQEDLRAEISHLAAELDRP